MTRMIYTPTVRKIFTDHYALNHTEETSVRFKTALNYGYTDFFGDFEFPVFEPEEFPITSKEQILKKIVTHYVDYSIAFPYEEQWLDHLERALNEIMPYYNEIFKLEWQALHGGIDGDEMTFRTFEDYHIYNTSHATGTNANSANGTHGNTVNGTDSSNDSGTNNATDAHIDYPDIGVGATGTTSNDNKYVSAKNVSSASNTNTHSGSNNTTENGTDSRTENGSHTDDVTSESYRIGATGKDPFTMKKIAQEAINNVEQMIIEDKEIRSLFYYDNNEMGLYL